MQTLTNVFAPLFAITVLRDLDDNVTYVRDHILLAVAWYCALATLFSWNVWTQLRPRSIASAPEARRSRGDTTRVRGQWRKVLIVGGVCASTLSIVFIVLTLAVAIFADAHYVQIASEPDEESATRRITFMNSTIEERDAKGLRARAYPSSNQRGWYMITINRSHSSRQSAENTLRRAKEELGNVIPADARIYSNSDVSASTKFKSYLKQALQPIRDRLRDTKAP